MHYALLSAGMDRAREVYLSSRDDLPKEAYTEDALNSLGYRLMRQGIFESAVDVFAFNAELYPSSANVHDSFGEGLFNAGRLQEALGHYRTSMRLDPLNQNGTAMIELIESALAEQN
jgi:tetratricopeptide (TPR) repeat protein